MNKNSHHLLNPCARNCVLSSLNALFCLYDAALKYGAVFIDEGENLDLVRLNNLLT